jgi:hypothetical protein
LCWHLEADGVNVVDPHMPRVSGGDNGLLRAVGGLSHPVRNVAMTVDREVPGVGQEVPRDAGGWDEIASELFSSAREAGVGFFTLVGSEFDEATEESSLSQMTPGPVEVLRHEKCPECGRRLVPVVSEQRLRGFCQRCYFAGSPYLFR